MYESKIRNKYLNRKNSFLEGIKNEFENSANKSIFKRKRISYKEMSLYFKIINILLSSGQNLRSVFEIIYKSMRNSKLKRNSDLVLKKLEGGENIYDAMKDIFNPFVVNVVKIASDSNDMAIGFQNLSQYYKGKNDMKMQLVKAVTYPAIVLIATIGITIFLITTIIPTLSKTLLTSGAKIPLSTKILIDIADTINNNGIEILIATAIIIIIFIFSFNKLKIKDIIVNSTLFRMYFNKFIESDISSSLIMLMGSGHNLYQAMEIAFTGVNIKYVRIKLIDALNKITAGEDIYSSLRQTNIFSEYFLSSIQIGMESGNVKDSLSNINIILKEEYKNILNLISETISPILILILGIIITGILMSIMIPIMTIGDII